MSNLVARLIKPIQACSKLVPTYLELASSAGNSLGKIRKITQPVAKFRNRLGIVRNLGDNEK